MKVLIVGLNPSRKHGDSPSLRRLYGWLDKLNLKTVSFINLYEGYEIIGSRSDAHLISNIWRDYDKVLALGERVSSVLRDMDVRHFQLPHPSGLNRLVNDHKYVHDELKACKNYLWGDQ